MRIFIAYVVSFAATTIGFAQAPYFNGLGFLPEGEHISVGSAVSDERQIVAGHSGRDGSSHAFRWEQGSRIPLGVLPGGSDQSVAYAISADGTVLAGFSTVTGGTQAFRWENGVMTPLEDLPGGGLQGAAQGISSDGLVVVGDSSGASGQAACRWVNGVALPLGLVAGRLANYAHDVSGDGRKIVGSAPFGAYQQAYVWNNGAMTALGGLPGAPRVDSVATGISTDGSTVVGFGISSTGGNRAFKWQDGTMVVLGNLPGGGSSYARDTNSDGSLIVGSSESAQGTQAMIWDAAHGMRSLRGVLQSEYGLDLTGWFLNEALSISADGMTITGRGINPQGESEGWIVHVPEPGPAFMLAVCVFFARRRGGA